MKTKTMLSGYIQTLLLLLAFAVSQHLGQAAERTNTNRGTTQMRIKIGSSNFVATLDDNPTTAAFKAMLPLTVEMQELNGNEKLYRLPNKLPTKSSNPGKIENGDLMLYGANTVVLFYKSFPTSYSYTRLGRINDPAGLASAVGSGNVTVTFELAGKP
ncbi:MAG: hypothetical protein L0Y58_17700 [Verrucomicrobia subdivision 3 bacterium]|nr:hypothetical protein [Limisphaerales bacterium]